MQPDKRISRRYFLGAATGAVSAAGMALESCGQGRTSRTASKKVLYVTVELGNPFYEQMINGIRKGLEGSDGWELAVRAGKSVDDASGQIDAMQAFLVEDQNHNSQLKGLIIVPAQSGPELCEMIRRYDDANIPIVNVDMPIDDAALKRSQAHVASFIGSDNFEGGRAAATLMADKLTSGGDVLVLLGAPGSLNAKNRRDGFVSRMNEIQGERRLIFKLKEWSCNWSATEASTATGTMIAGGKALQGIFAANDEMALGAAQAVEGANLGKRPKPIIVGYDATPNAKKAINEGRMYASISQNPDMEGERAAKYLQRLAARQTVPSKDIIPVSPFKNAT